MTHHTYTVPVSPKMLRETLAVVEAALGALERERPDYNAGGTVAAHRARVAVLIEECDRKRPVGPDGKHGDLHTAECGCGPHGALTSSALADAVCRDVHPAWWDGPWPIVRACAECARSTASLLDSPQHAARVARAQQDAVLAFVDDVASNGAYNGANDPGQRFYDESLNPWLRERALDYLRRVPTGAPARP